MTPEQKLDLAADISLFAICYISRSLVGGALRSLLGVPSTALLGSLSQRPTPVSPMLARLAENTRTAGPARLEKPTGK